MESQELLKYNYHEYLRIAKELPSQMREYGVFELKVNRCGLDLKFSHDGTIRVNDRQPIPVTSVDALLLACFPQEKVGSGFSDFRGYHSRPQDLKQVVPIHMMDLHGAISDAQARLDGFMFYKK